VAEIASATPRFEMRGIRRAFGATVALDGVDVAVGAGEVLALVGQNGAGKSTLMSVLAGAIAPDAGTMAIDGQPYAPASPLAARRAGVAMIYQALSLAPHLSVAENIVLGVEPTRRGLIDRAEMRARAARALEAVGQQGLSLDRLVGQLSPAEQQLVEIARAVALDCRVLVFDEPTSSLTRRDVERLFDLIRRLRESGHAVVYISHFLEEVTAIADRFIVLRDGRVAGSGRTSETTPHELANLMVGGEVQDLYPRSDRQAGAAVLSVRGLDASAEGFELRRGEILGIAGLIGAGRSHLLRSIVGLERVRRGEVTVGLWSGRPTPGESWRRGVGFVSEDRIEEGLALAMSVADNMTLSRLDSLGPRGLVWPSRQRESAGRWIDLLGIQCAGPAQSVASLSGGNQQKVVVARLLHHDVDVFVLDEPTRGIDVGSKAQIYAFIDDMVAARQARPKAVLMVSSYFPELLGLCDRIAVMSRGQLGEFKPAGEWTEHALVVAASGAIAS
jgi:ribose transport system ATP-binding protein